MTFKVTKRYIDVLQQITNVYNNRHHRTIEMAPAAVNETNILRVWQNIRKNQKKNNNKRINNVLRVNDYVRMVKKLDIFNKGFTPNYSDEIFKVYKVVERDPPVYFIKDLEDQTIEGAFYKQELQKIKFTEDTLYRIDRVIRKRTRKGIREALVLWKGFKKPSWIPVENIIDNGIDE